MAKTYEFSKPSGVLVEEIVSPGVKRPIAASDTASAYFQAGELCINIGANCILAIKSGDSVKIGATTHTTLDAAAVGLAGLFKSGGSTGEGVQNLVIERKTASYVLQASDNNKCIEMNVASGNTVTINNSIFSAGNQILVSQYGSGQTSFVAGSGVTIRSAGGKLKLSGQYSFASIIAISASEFYITGDIAL